MATESAAAVAGGLTSFMDMPNTKPPTLDAAALEDKYRRATGRAWANFGFYLGASNDNLEAIQRARPAHRAGHEGVHGRLDRQHAGRQPGDRSTRSSATRPRRSSPIAKTRR